MMHLIFHWVNLYFRIGFTIVAFNLLVGRLHSSSLVDAICQEAIKNGLLSAAQANTVYWNIVYIVIAWPLGIWETMRRIVMA